MAREPGWGKGRRIGASVRHRDKIPDFKRRKRNPLRDHVNRCAEIPRDRHGFIPTGFAGRASIRNSFFVV